MRYYALPGDTFSSICGKHYSAIAAPTLDAAAEWLAYTNPHLLAAGGVLAGTEYVILPYHAGGVIYARRQTGGLI